MNSNALFCACAVGFFAAAGCAPNPLRDDYWPQPGPLGQDVDSVRAPRDPQDAGRQEVPAPTGTVTLPEVLALSLQHNPALAGFAWEIRAREAQMIQASLWPNPEAEVEIEDFGGTGPASGFDGSETTLAIGQTLFLAGKIEKRTAVARYDRDLAAWDYEAARVAVFSNAAGDFIDVLASQRRVEIARETAELSERIFSSIGERVEAGKISPVERTKANVELAQARLELQRAERALTAARHRLAANWGSDSPTFDAVVGDLEQVSAAPEYEAVLSLVENNPELARWSSEMALRRAAIELALAEAVPDLTLRGGVKLLEGGDETAFVVGASMPLPIFDRNQGNILEARIRRAQGDRLYDAAAVRVRTDLAVAIQALRAAHDEVVALRDQILPSSRSAFDAAEEAFRQGKIGALDLLDAERTLFAARSQYVEALGFYHASVVTVEQLIGAPIDFHEAEPTPEGDSP